MMIWRSKLSHTASRALSGNSTRELFAAIEHPDVGHDLAAHRDRERIHGVAWARVAHVVRDLTVEPIAAFVAAHAYEHEIVARAHAGRGCERAA